MREFSIRWQLRLLLPLDAIRPLWRWHLGCIGIPANRGILAGCGYAVHFLKAMIKVEVKEEDQELRDFVDAMVCFKEDPTETQA
eukprot:7345634-Heterocapsa_arctica.AAC.1